MQTMNVPPGAFSMAVPSDACSLAAAGDGPRRMHMLALTGKPVEHWWWGTMVFELSGISMLKKKIAALLGHRTDQRLGYWDGMDVTTKGLELDGAFLANGDAQRVQDDLDAGFPWQGSISFVREGSRIEQLDQGVSTTVNGRTVKGPATVVRETKIDECSWCVFGADSGTVGAGLAADEGTVEIDVVVLHPTEGRRPPVAKEVDGLTLDQRREIALAYAPGMTAAEVNEHCPAAATAISEAGALTAQTAERKRAGDLATAAGPDDAASALKAFLAGTSLGDFQGQLARERGEKITALQAELATARTTPPVIPGADPADQGGSPDSPEAQLSQGGGDPVAKFESLVAAIEERDKLTRAKAMRKAVHEHKAEHQAYVAAQRA